MNGNGQHHVVILGGGFGGLYAAKSLAGSDCRVTLVDRRNFHLFQPLLYQVATGGLSPADIASPIRAILRNQQNAHVLLGEAVDLDPETRRLILADGEVSYDSLLVATGARNDYFGHEDWMRHAPGLKTLEDATAIRKRILYAFEAAERESDQQVRNAWLTFVVVGAGPTGVELAGTLGEIANDTLRDNFRRVRPEAASILLLEGASRVLPGYPEDLSRKAERALIKLAVRSRTGVRVTEINGRGVRLEGAAGERWIEAKTVVWAAGVAASPFGGILQRTTGCELDRKGRVAVNPDLSVKGHPEILVLGDLAMVRDAEGSPLPGVAPVAMQEGRYVAGLILDRLAGKRTPPFRYRDKGSMATIGRAAAVAEIGRLHVSGILAWFTWLFIHLMYLAGFQNRLKVLIQWAFHYLTFNRGARLIAPEPDLSDPPPTGSNRPSAEPPAPT